MNLRIMGIAVSAFLAVATAVAAVPDPAITDDAVEMVLSVTDACSLACRYCVYSGNFPGRSEHGVKRMSPEDVDRAVEYLVEHSVESDTRNLGFYGGEPTVAFDLIQRAMSKLSQLTDTKKFTYGVTTNLFSAGEEMLRYFYDKNFTIYVSLDGPKAVHDRYRVTADGRPSFDAIKRNLETLRAMDESYYKKHVRFNCVLCPPHNRMDEIRRFFEEDELVRDNGWSVGYANIPNEGEFAEQLRNQPSGNDLGKLWTEYFELAVKGHIAKPGCPPMLCNLFDRTMRHTYKRIVLKRRLPDAFFPGGLCVLGSRKVFVRADGAFFPCERIPEHEDFRMGSIDEGFDIQKAFSLQQHHASLTSEECKKCWALLLCSGICIKDEYDNDGRVSRERRLEACKNMTAHNYRELCNLCSIMEENPKALEFLREYSMS